MPQDQGTRHGRPASAGWEPTDIHAYYDKSWAITVGITDYGGRHGRLPNACNDAKAIALLLRHHCGFEEVYTLCDVDATRDAILTWLRDKLPSQVGPNDRLIFFFAGHGTSRELNQGGSQRGYLIPYDAEQVKYADYIDMQELSNACGLIPAKHVFIIIDCCFSAVAAVASRAGTPSPPEGTINDPYLKRITKKRAWQILTAGDADEVVADSGVPPRHSHSPFTSALLAGLEGEADQNRDGLITDSDLAAYVKPWVVRETTVGGAKGQAPFFSYLAGSDHGDFVFVVRGRTLEEQPVVSSSTHRSRKGMLIKQLRLISELDSQNLLRPELVRERQEVILDELLRSLGPI